MLAVGSDIVGHARSVDKFGFEGWLRRVPRRFYGSFGMGTARRMSSSRHSGGRIARVSFDSSRSFGARIRTIATNAAFDHLRAQRPRAGWIRISDDIEARVLQMPALPERAIMFPMAVVPNVWGLWNMLYLALRPRIRLSIGLHGALLPLFLIPGRMALAYALDVFTIQLHYALPIIPIGMGIYYLAWKSFVGFLNQEVGIA